MGNWLTPVRREHEARVVVWLHCIWVLKVRLSSLIFDLFMVLLAIFVPEVRGEEYWYCTCFLQSNIWIVLVLFVFYVFIFVRCFLTFFHDWAFKTGNAQWALNFIKGCKLALIVFKVLRVLKLLGSPKFKTKLSFLSFLAQNSEIFSHFLDQFLSFNCSQTKLVAIMLFLWPFHAIFCLTDLPSDTFDPSSKRG